MHTESVVERSAAPAAAVPEHVRAEPEVATGAPAPASSPGRHRPARSVFGKLLGVLRGDKYMAAPTRPNGWLPRRAPQ